ncbi:MAG: GNAT family N-acetyltransferase [Desulfobacula sp.]|nr:GNAT family N-acetyltransferase [Desulfobacula sp.]
MNTHNLNRIFYPNSVVLIGAGIKENSVGRTVMKNLSAGGFEGKIYYVNPPVNKSEKKPDIKSDSKPDTKPDAKNNSSGAFAGVRNLPDDIDLAVIATPLAGIPDILEVCSEKKMGGVVIVSGSDNDQDESKKEITHRIRRISKQTGLRVIGPDSVGIVNSALGLNASYMHRMPVEGKIVFLSQSGAVCTSVLDMAMRENVGFSHFVSLGDMQDVCFADLIDFFGSQYHVESIVMYVERLEDIRNFMSAARAVSRVKPIIALKSDHTGAQMLLKEHSSVKEQEILDEDELYDAAFKRAGILRIKEFEALFDCAEFLGKQKRPRGSRLAIISNAGAISVMAKDALAAHGLEPAILSDDTTKKLQAALKENRAQSNLPKNNPINLLGPSLRRGYVDAVKICMEAPEIDGLLLLNSPVGTDDVTSLARELAALLNISPCPVLTSWMGGLDIDKARAVFNRAGIVTYETPDRAVRAFVNLYQSDKNIEMLQQLPVRTDKRLEINYEKAGRVIDQGMSQPGDKLSNDLAKKLVCAYGIPVGSDAAKTSPDYELTISAVRHPSFGPVIRFGMGGIMTEVFKDVSIALPPLNRLLARTAIEDTKIATVFSGYKGIEKIDMAALEEILIRVSRLVTDFPQIKQLDINPIQVLNGSVKALHGKVILEKSPMVCTSRLVISPYPYWQEKTVSIKNDDPVFIRPVRPSDAQQMIELFDDLSEETVYMRFFSPIKEISRPMLIRLTQIDYDREIALIAFFGEKKARKIVGVARIIFMPDSKEAEFAIVLADAWQGRGLGIQLLHHALDCAKKYHIEQVWGPVITTNKGMLKMGEKIGFKVRHDPDSGEYKLTIPLDSLPPLPQN